MVHTECSVCGEISSTTRDSGFRCQRCGSGKVSRIDLEAIAGAHKIRRSGGSILFEPLKVTEVSGRFSCTSCAKEFDLAYSPGETPLCQFCKGADLTNLSPVVGVVNADQRNFSTAQVKRFRFIQREWKNFRTFERICRSLVKTMRRLPFEVETVEGAEKATSEWVRTLEDRHEEILKEFEGLSDKAQRAEPREVKNLLVNPTKNGVGLRWDFDGHAYGFNVFRCSGENWNSEQSVRLNRDVIPTCYFLDGINNSFRRPIHEVPLPSGMVCYRVEVRVEVE